MAGKEVIGFIVEPLSENEGVPDEIFDAYLEMRNRFFHGRGYRVRPIRERQFVQGIVDEDELEDYYNNLFETDVATQAA